MSQITGTAPRKIYLGCGYDLESGLPWNEQMKNASSWGFTYWEFAMGSSSKEKASWVQPEDAEDFKQLRDELKLKSVGARIQQDWDLASDEGHSYCLENMKSIASAAMDLGAKRLVARAPAVDFESMTDPMWERFFQGMRELSDFVESGKARLQIPTAGTQIPVPGEPGIWNYEPTFMVHPDGLEKTIHALEDCLWLEYSPGELKPFWPKEKMFWSQLIHPWVDGCRMSDRKWVNLDHRHWRTVALGDDFLEYGPILRSLKFSGMCWIAPCSYPDPEEAIFRSIEYSKNLEENFLEFYFVEK